MPRGDYCLSVIFDLFWLESEELQNNERVAEQWKTAIQ